MPYDLNAIREKTLTTKQRLKEPWLAMDEGDDFGFHLYGSMQFELEIQAEAHRHRLHCGITAEQRQIAADLLGALHRHYVEMHLNMIDNGEVLPSKRVQVNLYDYTGHVQDQDYPCGFTVAIQIAGVDGYYGLDLPGTFIHITDGDRYVRVRRESRKYPEFKVRIGHQRFEQRVAKAIRKLTDAREHGWIAWYPELPLKWREVQG